MLAQELGANSKRREQPFRGLGLSPNLLNAGKRRLSLSRHTIALRLLVLPTG
jgi:hypothetical protein